MAELYTTHTPVSIIYAMVYEMNDTDPEAIFNEMTFLTSIYAGMTYDRILS